MTYTCPYCCSVTGHSSSLLKHLRGRRLYGGHQVPSEEAARIVERLGNGTPAPASQSSPLHRGHWRSLELLENTAAVRDTLAAYARAINHPVYLRPTKKGLTVMSLDATTPAMVGIGGINDCCISALPPAPSAIEGAVQAYQAKLAALKRRSVEERYVLARIRKALENGLELGDGLLFLHQEWRLSSSRKIDVLALDRRNGQLVVIEAKKSEATAFHPGTAKQAAEYAAQLGAHAAECGPYFERLAAALARAYCFDAQADPVNISQPPRWEIWWPGGRIQQSSYIWRSAT